jgi:hypothetical protein
MEWKLVLPKDRYITVYNGCHKMRWRIEGRINLDGEDLYIFYCDNHFECSPFELNNRRILERVEYICQKYSLISNKKLSTKE